MSIPSCACTTSDYPFVPNDDLLAGKSNRLAEREWEEGDGEWFSPFDINEVSDEDDANLYIERDDYGNTGWVGKAYYNDNPKEILLNEWYLANSTPHNYTIECYTNTAIHEMGHTHGLDHYDCPTDGEIMEPVHMDKYNLSEGDWDGVFDIY